MKLALANLVPAEYVPARLRDIFDRVEKQGNLLAEGRLQGRHFTATAIPTTGDFAQGDIVWKSNPTEAGGAGSKYVVIGWISTVSGSPGTLLEMRTLTGN
jgi:hypothetical protein